MPKKRPRALCITNNLGLRKTLRRTLQASGSTVEFRDSIAPDDGFEAQLVVLDKDARKSCDLDDLLRAAGSDSDVIVLGESLEDAEVVDLVRNNPFDHVVSEGHKPDETELVVTSVKLLSGDIFGLEKYLSWGVDVQEVCVASYEEKRTTLLDVAEHARTVGARRQVVAKIESVTDELLMNALYDAPAVSRGESPVIPNNPDERHSDPRAGATVRFASDGHYFAVSVEDNYGELEKTTILDHLTRARRERGRPRNYSGPGGAGLGLYFVLSSVTRFIANIDPGKRTEVVCLFDLRQNGRAADSCTRSLHIFHTDPTA